MAETAIQTVGIRPAAATPGTLFTCPSGKEASLIITWANDDAAATTIYVAVRAAGAALANTHYRVGPSYNVFGRDASERRSITVTATDVVECLSASGNVTFQVSGILRDISGAPATTLAVTDGVTTVVPTNTITFTEAGSVTDLGGGNAQVDNSGGGGGGGATDDDARLLAIAALAGLGT